MTVTVGFAAAHAPRHAVMATMKQRAAVTQRSSRLMIFFSISGGAFWNFRRKATT